MRYELFLRSESALDPEVVDQMREQAAGHDAPSSLTLELYESEGQVRGMDLAVSASQPLAAEGLCGLAFDLCDRYQLSAFDPQQGRVVLRADLNQIREKLEQVGSFSQAALLSPSPASTGSTTANTRIWLLLVGAFVVFLLLSKAMQCAV